MTCKWDGKHKGHNVISLREANNLLKTNIETCIKSLGFDGRILQDIQQIVPKELEKIQIKKKEVREFIRQQFSEIRKILEENETKMLRAIDEIQLDEDKLNKCVIEAQSTLATLSSTHQKAKSILDNLNNTELITKVALEAISIIKKPEIFMKLNILTIK